MRITTVGAGRVAHALGSRLAKNRYDITFGVRDPQSRKVASLLEDCGTTSRIDPTNPIVIGADEASRGLLIGHSTSAGEQVAQWAHGAKVAKAFNTTSSGNMLNPKYGNRRAVTFVAADDAKAKAVASGLARELGLEPIDAGRLEAARFLEPVGLLWIKMAYGLGWGPEFTFDVLRRSME